MIQRRGFLAAVVGGLLSVCGLKAKPAKRLRFTGGASPVHQSREWVEWINGQPVVCWTTTGISLGLAPGK